MYEKTAPCKDYPPDEIVTFTNLTVAYDGVVAPAAWTTGVVDQVCDFKANIIDPNTVSITWNTKAEDPSPEAVARSQSVPFGARKARSA